MIARAALALAVLLTAAPAIAQNRVRTETIPVPPTAAGKPSQNPAPARVDKRPGRPPPEVVFDLARLPPAVARMRTRILEAARDGSLDRVVTVMQSNELMPIFSFGPEKDPAGYWKSNYAESDGLEVLAILIDILEAPYVHADKGTSQEMYIWPYFARYPIDRLDAEQKVQLFRILTGTDWRETQEAGAYVFFRLGIGPDGTWHFFVAGD